MIDQLSGVWQVVLRSRHDGRIVGHYERHDERCRWTTDPKRGLRFSIREHAETLVEDVRRQEPRNADMIHVESV